MAFKVEVIYWGGTLDISTGTTFGLEDMTGLGAANVRRLSERGPQQDGDTDLGYRADPGVLTLPHLLKGTTDAHLDSLRDTLQQVYLPTEAPLYLRVTRDDGAVRQLDVHRTGPLDMPLIRTQRPGHFARAVVQLKASNPLWYDPTPKLGTVLLGTVWYLAYGSIGTANVLEYVEYPTQGQQWTYSGTVPYEGAWTVAFRSAPDTTDGHVAFSLSASEVNADPDRVVTGFVRGHAGYPGQYAVLTDDFFIGIGTSIMTAGTRTYFVIAHNNPDLGGRVYRDGVHIAGGEDTSLASLGFYAPANERRWRSNPAGTATSFWEPELPRAAIYNIALNSQQRANLHAAMAANGTAFSLDIAYAGQWPEFPVIRINGPISDPVLVNATTGERLDFTGHAIGSGDYYIIDTRYGRKTVTNSGGDNKIGELSSSSDLVSFHIAPASEVSGGTNTFQLTGTAVSGNTNAVITYYNRFPAF